MKRLEVSKKRYVRLLILSCLSAILLCIQEGKCFSKTIPGKQIMPSYGYLYAIDGKTGKEIWRFKTDCPVATPTVSNGVVYFGTTGISSNKEQHYLFALDAATGKEKWKYDVFGPIDSAPTIENGRVYIGSGNVLTDLYIYDLTADAGKWKLRAGPIGGSARYFTTFNSVAFYGQDFAESCYMSTLDVKTGKEKWKFATRDLVFSPAFREGTAYFGSYDGYLHAVDQETGKEKWRFKGTIKREYDLLEKNDIREFPSPPWDDAGIQRAKGLTDKLGLPAGRNWNMKADDTLDIFNKVLTMDDLFRYVKREDLLHCLGHEEFELYKRAETGKLNKNETISLNKAILQSIFPHVVNNIRPFPGFSSETKIIDGIIYISGYGYLYAVDVKNGKEIWKYDQTDQSIPIFTKEEILFLDENKAVRGITGYSFHALDLTTGKDRWIMQVPLINPETEGQRKLDEYYYLTQTLSCITVADGVAYCVTRLERKQYLCAIDIKQKKVNWITEIASEGFQHSIGIQDDVVYFGTGFDSGAVCQD